MSPAWAICRGYRADGPGDEVGCSHIKHRSEAIFLSLVLTKRIAASGNEIAGVSDDSASSEYAYIEILMRDM